MIQILFLPLWVNMRRPSEAFGLLLFTLPAKSMCHRRGTWVLMTHDFISSQGQCRWLGHRQLSVKSRWPLPFLYFSNIYLYLPWNVTDCTVFANANPASRFCHMIISYCNLTQSSSLLTVCDLLTHLIYLQFLFNTLSRTIEFNGAFKLNRSRKNLFWEDH